MTNTRRMFPLITLVGIIFISAALATLSEQNQLALFLLLFLVGLMAWIYAMGGGWRLVDKDTAIIVEDFTGTPHQYAGSSYLYIPIVNAIAAKMPTYPISHEFQVESIDTKTPKIQQIKKITVKVSYIITDFELCYNKAADIKQLIKSLEQNDKLTPDNPTLWIQALSKQMQGIITGTTRRAIWDWATILTEESDLRVNTNFKRKSDDEFDPYSLSLNRYNLLKFVQERIELEAQKRGMRIRSLSFAGVEIDKDLIDKATKDEDREIKTAIHEAKKEAAAIREKGMAEAEVRAATVTKIIEALMNQQQITITDQMLYNIVRAATHSDGQLILNATADREPATTVKAA